MTDATTPRVSAERLEYLLDLVSNLPVCAPLPEGLLSPDLQNLPFDLRDARAQLKTVLDREAETIARYDAKLATLTATVAEKEAELKAVRETFDTYRIDAVDDILAAQRRAEATESANAALAEKLKRAHIDALEEAKGILNKRAQAEYLRDPRANEIFWQAHWAVDDLLPEDCETKGLSGKFPDAAPKE